jgi:hypothetical protein
VGDTGKRVPHPKSTSGDSCMIIHKITTRKEYPIAVYKSPVEKYIGKFNTPEHKIYIYNRVMLRVNGMDWGRITYKGEQGYVSDVYPFELCQWDGLKCLCIEIILDGNQVVIVHPSDIKKG